MNEMAAIATATRKSGMDPRVSFGVAAALVFFLISGGVPYLNIQTIKQDNLRIVHSHQVITTLDGILSSVKDAETGQRGFFVDR